MKRKKEVKKRMKKRKEVKKRMKKEMKKGIIAYHTTCTLVCTVYILHANKFWTD